MFASLDPPPIGTVTSVAELQQRLRVKLREEGATRVLVGAGYDDTLLAERRHPTRVELDAVSRDIPVIVLHVSGHMAVANSKAMELAGINADTEDPSGGHIKRQVGSREPEGLLQESAMRPVLALIPPAPPLELYRAFEQTALKLASLGITTATEHAAMPADIAALRAFARTGALNIDVVAYPHYSAGEAAFAALSPGYRDRLRIGGIKLTLDGSIQGYTGFLSAPYYQVPSDRGADYRGTPVMNAAALQTAIDRLYQQAIPFAAHANGDAAIDLLIDAVRSARQSHPARDLRPVIIHAQTMREDQLDAAEKLGLIPSFFVDHVYFWGERHRRIFLGPTRAARISPAASALARGVPFSLHDDAPVVPPNPLRSVWTAVIRQTADGEILGTEQRIDVLAALRAVTFAPAYHHHEEQEKGSIEVGKRADLVILDADPRSIPPEALRRLEVVETIKDGDTVYQRRPSTAVADQQRRSTSSYQVCM